MRLLSILSICLLLLSCADAPTLGEVDLKAFKNDRGGCKNLRQQDIDKLKAVEDQLLGKTENEIVELLGRYDVQVLDRRQTKMFVYYLEKGDQCNDLKNAGYVRTMVLRFNAISLVREVTFRIGLPA